ncbi:protein kinase, partial [Reticulomyxa filosa]
KKKKKKDIAAKLAGHNNVLQIYGYTKHPYSIVAEFLNGGSMEVAFSLTHKESTRRFFTFREVIGMMCQAAKGILHLHEAKIVHRDIAARNILLDFIPVRELKGSRVRAVVCDFGLSRIAEGGAERGNFTETKVGPIKWMSPESICGNLYNTKTDAYSFGILMWEVFTGSEPYPDLPKISVAYHVLHKNYRPNVPNSWPPPLQYLIQRCWQTQPEYRPTFSEIVAELSHLSGIMDSSNALNAPDCPDPTVDGNDNNDIQYDISQMKRLPNYKLPTKLHTPVNSVLVELPDLVRKFHPDMTTLKDLLDSVPPNSSRISLVPRVTDVLPSSSPLIKQDLESKEFSDHSQQRNSLSFKKKRGGKKKKKEQSNIKTRIRSYITCVQRVTYIDVMYKNIAISKCFDLTKRRGGGMRKEENVQKIT